MSRFKTRISVTISILITLLSANTNAASSKSASLQWRGLVPDLVPGDGIRITGLSGDLGAVKGTLAPNTDGTFDSSILWLEAHFFSYDSNGLVIGDLAPAKWVMRYTDVAYNGTPISPSVGTIVTRFNGQVMAQNDFKGAVEAERIAITVSQTADLGDISGQMVQVSLAVTAIAI